METRRNNPVLVGGGVLFLLGFLGGLVWSPAPPRLEMPAVQLKMHDKYINMNSVDRLERLPAQASSWAVASSLTTAAASQRKAGVEQLAHASKAVHHQASMSVRSVRGPKLAAEELRLAGRLMAALQGRMRSLVAVAAGGPAPTDDGMHEDEPELVVEVHQRPFGMHVRRGSVVVSEVFPGFPAMGLGVRKGCEVLMVGSEEATPGNWMPLFQNTALPFNLTLFCPKQEQGSAKARAKAGLPALRSRNPKRYRVIVVKRPYGMDVQVQGGLPRVTDVLPGFPAEKAGVRRGFVLVEVNDKQVHSKTWHEAFQAAKVPFTLTFDTTVPAPAGNTSAAEPVQAALPTAAPLPDDRYEDFRCEVGAHPFGMNVEVQEGDAPRVISVTGNALEAGVRAGDVLVEVAGRDVIGATWFAAFQQAAPPFGLRFRRPLQ